MLAVRSSLAILLAALALPAAARAATPAAVGQPAPDFELKDLDGKPFKLSAHRGKVVVLEWFNPGCPFVNMAHTSGSLKGLAAQEAAKGVVWVAINSNAAGKQGSDPGDNREAARRFGLTHPVLRDEDGKVGRTYGATNTPHMMVVDAQGTLAYRGAIDDTAGGDPEQGKAVRNHVVEALSDLRAGRPVRVTETKAWGCGVKYGE